MRNMHITMRPRSALYWTWIACLAILFNAFAPLLSHAMGAPAASGASGAEAIAGIEVCTALGMKTMALPDAALAPASTDTGKLHKSMNHCGYCAAHAGAHGLPPPMAAAFVPAAGRDAWPPLYYRSSRVLFPWALAQPRAPPAIA
jgi:hypothetical protein